MGRVSFVAWLFVMAIASLVLAIGERSLGWFLGAIVLAFVASYARKQINKEEETGRQDASLGFVAKAIILMLLAMAVMFWLQHRS